MKMVLFPEYTVQHSEGEDILENDTLLNGEPHIQATAPSSDTKSLYLEVIVPVAANHNENISKNQLNKSIKKCTERKYKRRPGRPRKYFFDDQGQFVGMINKTKQSSETEPVDKHIVERKPKVYQYVYKEDGGIRIQRKLEGNTSNSGTLKAESDQVSDKTAKQDYGRIVRSKLLRRRKRRGQGRQSHDCKLCGKEFSQKGNLRAHMLVHSADRPFPCKHCSKSFKCKEALRRHLLTHSDIKPFVCSICNEGFCSANAVQEHEARHTDTRNYQCDICQRWFRQASCLRRHIITHTSELPYACETCGKRFAQLVYLKSHIRVHTGEKPFKCDLCSKAFSHQSDVKRHRTVHTGQRPYVCPICSAAFKDPSSCRRHFKEHSGKKPYVCQLCSDSFKRAGQLKAHLLKKHFKSGDVSVVKSTNNILQFVYKDCEQSQVKSLISADQQDRTDTLQRSYHLRDDEAQQIICILQEGEAPEQVMLQQVDGSEIEAQTADAEGIVEEQSIPETAQVTEYIIQLPQEHAEQSSKQEQAVVLPALETNEPDIQYNETRESRETPEEGKSDRIIELHNYTEILSTDKTETKVHSVQMECDSREVSDDSRKTSDSISRTFSTSTQSTEKAGASLEFIPESRKDAQSEDSKSDIQPSTPLENNRADEHVIVDFVNHPNFSSQDYYNWLSNFTDMCKMADVPLETDLFSKISQVHKTLSDVLAMPSGVLTNKDNFKIVMSIAKDLNQIVNEHLLYVLSSLDGKQVPLQ